MFRLRKVAITVVVGMTSMPAWAQGVANVTSFKGEVTVQEAATKAVRTAAYIGTTTRVRNGSLANGDQITTGAGAEATIQFGDGSIVKLQESGKLAVSEAPSKDARLTGGRPVSRKIRVAVGKLSFDVKPNGRTLTEFETPAGVAAIRGTTGSLSYNATNVDIAPGSQAGIPGNSPATAVEVGFTASGKLEVSVETGKVILANNTGTSYIVELAGGQRIAVNFDKATGSFGFTTNCPGGSTIEVKVGNTTLKMGNADMVKVEKTSPTATTTQVTVVKSDTGVVATDASTGQTSTLGTGQATTATPATTAIVPTTTVTTTSPTTVLTEPTRVIIADTTDASPLSD